MNAPGSAPFRLLPAAGACGLLLLAAVGTAPADASKELDRVARFIDDGDYRSAEIALKGVLQQDPGIVAARLRLADLYLQLGDGSAAEKEIRRAMKLGAEGADLALDLAEALLLQAEHQTALEQLDAIDPDAADRADLLALRGRALLGLAKLEEAESAFSAAIGLDPDHRIAGMGLARLSLLADDPATAASITDGLLAAYPDDVPLLLMRGEIDRKQGEQEAALQRFAAALKRQPDNLRALLAHATVLIALQRFDEARKDLDRIDEIAPDIVVASYLRGISAFYQQDWTAADRHLSRVLAAQPDHLQSLLLMGVVSYARDELQIAEGYLSRVLRALPENLQAAKVLAATRLKLQEPRRAIETLEPFAEQRDPQVMALLGSAYMSAGDEEEGQRWLSRAVEAAPNVAALRTQLALTFMAAGQTGEAIDELEAAVDLGQDVLQADVLLVLALLKQGNYEAAIAASAALESRRPESPIPSNLSGLALMSQGRLDEARAKFARALEVDPQFITALINAARAHTAEGDLDAAEERYREALDQEPSNLPALLGLAGIAERRDDPEAVLTWLNRAQDARPSAVRPGLLLARAHMAQGDHLRALAIATDLSGRFPQNPDVLELLGRAQALTGDLAGAVRTFQNAVDLRPDDANLHYLLGGVYGQAQEHGAAVGALRRAVELRPADIEARVALASVLIAAQRSGEAVEVARSLQRDFADRAVGYRLEGQAQMTARDFRAALPPLEKALQTEPTTEAVMRLASVHGHVGSIGKAIDLIEHWSAANPEDLQVQTQLAMLLHGQGREAEAMAIYQRLYERGVANVVVLNNLAWILHKQGDEQALEVARVAYEQAPNRPEIADTYGWILYNSGETTEGLNILQQAHLAYPTQTEITYHVARALEGVGRTDEALMILRKLLRDYPNAPEAERARALVHKLAPADAG